MVAAASKGLGRAIAEALAREGCSLSICSRSLDSLQDASTAIRNLGAEVLPVACDVSQAGDLQRWFEETVVRFDQVDDAEASTAVPPATNSVVQTAATQ